MSASRPEPSEIQRIIEAHRARAQHRVEVLKRELAAIIEAAQDVTLDDEHDPDGATVGFERAQVTALLAQARLDVDELERAEVRVVSGDYGKCRQCGQTIPLERLTAIPTATTCVPCASLRARRS